MATIFAKRKVRIPTIATWKWKRDNYQVPLVFQLPGARCSLFLDPSEAGWRDRHVLWEAYILLEFPSAHKILVDGLKSSGKAAGQAAEMIYGLYIQVYEQFESVLRTTGNVIYLMQDRPMSFDEFFHEDTFLGEGIQWWGDGIEPKQFRPKVTRNRRRINPLFKHDQIMTLQKWKNLQAALDQGDLPFPEILELLRIRSKLAWHEKKIATIESAILVETIIREYGERIMAQLGFSKNKIKSLRDDLNFNTVLNIVLHFPWRRPKQKKIARYIQSVDILRKVRNDVVHGNIPEADINEASVRQGIDSALRLIEFIKKKSTSP